MTNEPRGSRADIEALAFARGALTRRDFMRRVGLAGGSLAAANLLAACGGSVGGASTQNPASSAAAVKYPHTVSPDWNWSNWTLYIDEKNHRHPSIDMFDAKYKTHTNYIEDINDNEEFFGKFQATLQAGQDIGRDMVTLTDWMAGKWVQFGYVEPLEWDILPNVKSNLLPTYHGRSIDPNDEFLVPWQSGLTGIGYNSELTGRDLTTVSDLWDPKFKGKVSLLTEMRDTFGLVMLNLGIDPVQVHDRRRAEGPRRDQALRRQPADPRLLRQRLLEPSGQRRPHGRDGVVRATWCSCCPTTRTSSSWCRTRAACSGPTT